VNWNDKTNTAQSACSYDLGIVGGQISNRKSLTTIKPHEVYIAKLKAKRPDLFGGK
jgi:hypothetical protein